MTIRDIYTALMGPFYDLEGHNVFYLDFLYAVRQLDPATHVEHWADTWINHGATLHTESWFANGQEVVVYVMEDDCGEWVSMKGML